MPTTPSFFLLTPLEDEEDLAENLSSDDDAGTSGSVESGSKKSRGHNNNNINIEIDNFSGNSHSNNNSGENHDHDYNYYDQHKRNQGCEGRIDRQNEANQSRSSDSSSRRGKELKNPLASSQQRREVRTSSARTTRSEGNLASKQDAELENEESEERLDNRDESRSHAEIFEGTDANARVGTYSPTVDAEGAWTQVRNRKPQKKKPNRSIRATASMSGSERRRSSGSIGSFAGNASTTSSGGSSSDGKCSRRKSREFTSKEKSLRRNSNGADHFLNRSWARDPAVGATNHIRKPGAISWHVPHNVVPVKTSYVARQNKSSSGAKTSEASDILNIDSTHRSVKHVKSVMLTKPSPLQTASHSYEPSSEGDADDTDVCSEGELQEPPADRKTFDKINEEQAELESKVQEMDREKLRIKIWNVLFRNVTHTIDELYYMCEFDSSDEQCVQAEELLLSCLHEFQELRSRIQSQAAVVDSSFDGMRESSRGLAWEVRKNQAVPSPVTLLFGSRLQCTSGEDNADFTSHKGGDNDIADITKSHEAFYRRGSLQSLQFSAQQLNLEGSNISASPDLPNFVPRSSAWVRKPKIVTDLPHGQVHSHSAKQDQNSATGKVILRYDNKPTFEVSNNLLSRQSILSKKFKSQCKTPEREFQEQGEIGEEELMQTRVMDFSRPSTSDSLAQDGISLLENEDVPETSPTVSSMSCGPLSSSPRPSVFTFEDLAGDTSGLRWGDEEVGLTQDAVDMLKPISPHRKRACDVCNRYVVPGSGEQSTCSACLSKAGMLRTLHQKLSSPERRKPSPSETKRRQAQKQTTARLNREKIDLQRQAKLRLQSSRQEQIAKTKEEVMLAQGRAINERLERAAVAREAKLKSVAKKAENEARKVNEVQFINEMTEQDRTAQLHKKLEDGEKRRLVFIGSIREKAEKQIERVEACRLREEDRERQLREAMQRRHEEAEKRKAEALEEQRRKLDEMVLEASAKVSERRTEMEKEREAKLALQRERKERAEQERRRLLLAKRTSSRASTVSPLLTNSGYSTPSSSAGQNGPISVSTTSGGSAPAATFTQCSTGADDSNIVTPTFRLKNEESTGSSPQLHTSSNSLVVNPLLPGSSCGYSTASPRTALFGSAEDEAAEKARFAEEVSRSGEEMQTKEKQMKKRARKVKAKIASMAVPMYLDRISSPPKRIHSAVRHLEEASINSEKSEAAETLVKYARDNVRGVASLHVLSAFIKTCAQEIGRPSVQGVVIISHCLEGILCICKTDPGLLRDILKSGNVTAIVDICVQLLRAPVSKDNVYALVHGLRLISNLLISLRESNDESGLGIELVRLCIYSSLALRAGERCAQIKCGKKWESTGCPVVEEAVRLVGSSLRLLESMVGVIALSQNGADDSKKEQAISVAKDILLDAAKSSTLFRILSQVVAAFIAVQGTHAPRAATRKIDAGLRARLRFIAATGLRTLNLLACLDLDSVQEILSSPAMPFELQQLFRYVLMQCEDEDATMPAPPRYNWSTMSQNQVADNVPREELFAELIVFLGFYAQSNEKNQESLNWGRAPTPLVRLCSVPFPYFSSQIGKSILFPTLLSICSGNTRATNIVAEEMSPELLTAYLRARNNYEERETQKQRFPHPLWESALAFFEDFS
mmetsp:Transcript_946/g.2222  ORF Transcript_946/g.2222 Transcript_946/m.2222 type:complete len:1635 (-) Transcript_946:48-4952(-)